MKTKDFGDADMLTLAWLLCRRLSLALTTVVMLISLCTTYALQYMPNDPLHIRRNLTLYSLFVVGASAAGLIGAIKVRSNTGTWE